MRDEKGCFQETEGRGEHEETHNHSHTHVGTLTREGSKYFNKLIILTADSLPRPQPREEIIREAQTSPRVLPLRLEVTEQIYILDKSIYANGCSYYGGI